MRLPREYVKHLEKLGAIVSAVRCKGCGGPLEKGSRSQYHPGCSRNKYSAQKAQLAVEGRVYRFDSRREAARFWELWLRYRAGQISRPLTQVPFALVVNGQLVCSYVADFVYAELVGKDVVVEDAKGRRTEAYRIKAKLFKAVWGLAIKEV